MVLVTMLTLFFPFQTWWVSLFLVCCLGCLELSREIAKMVEMHREKRKREATKIISSENGRREKKEVRYILSDLLHIIDRSDFCFYYWFRLEISPLIFITRCQLTTFSSFLPFSLFSSWLLCDIRESDHPQWYNPLCNALLIFFSFLFLWILHIDKRRFCKGAQLWTIPHLTLTANLFLISYPKPIKPCPLLITYSPSF